MKSHDLPNDSINSGVVRRHNLWRALHHLCDKIAIGMLAIFFSLGGMILREIEWAKNKQVGYAWLFGIYIRVSEISNESG